MLSRFEEARAKPTLSASPSITSAVLPNPSLPSFSRNSFVLPSLTSRMSTPALASRVCTLTFILAFLALVSLGLGLVRLSFLNGILGSLDLSFGLGGSASFLLGGNRRDFLVARQRRDLVDRGFVDQARLGHVDFFFLERFEDAGRIGRGVRARKLDRVADGQPAA